MSRIEFMEELERLLSDIPIEERKEALQYYNDYFADAGEEHEDKIIMELGSPARIAAIIKADLNSNEADHETRGYFTEKGYEDTVYQDEKYEIVNASTNKKDKNDEQQDQKFYREDEYRQAGTDTGQRTRTSQPLSGGKLALIILAAIFIIPVGFPMIFSILGVVFGLAMSLLGITVGFGIAGIVLIGLGIGLFFLGLMQIGVPFTVLLLCGAGLLVFGLGVLFMMVSVLIGKLLLPAFIRGFVSLCRLPFKNRSVTA